MKTILTVLLFTCIFSLSSCFDTGRVPSGTGPSDEPSPVEPSNT